MQLFARAEPTILFAIAQSTKGWVLTIWEPTEVPDKNRVAPYLFKASYTAASSQEAMAIVRQLEDVNGVVLRSGKDFAA